MKTPSFSKEIETKRFWGGVYINTFRYTEPRIGFGISVGPHHVRLDWQFLKENFLLDFNYDGE
jgi:hypothetical protein